MGKAVLQNTEQKLTITFDKLVFFSQKKKYRVFDRFTSHNLEPDNRDSLIFKTELSDKNSIKERHLPYNQLLSKTITEVMTEEISKEKVQKINQMLKDAVIGME